MKRHEATIFDFTKDPDDMLLVTSHERYDSETMAIHCTEDGYSGFTMYITKSQATNLIGKLQQALSI